MSGSASGAAARADSLTLSVHGPHGVVDLVVPAAASVADVAREYADQAGLATAPSLWGRGDEPLPPTSTLAEAGIATGALLVVVDPPGGAAQEVTRRRPRRRAAEPAHARPRGRTPGASPAPGAGSAAWFTGAAATAVLAGWAAARFGSADLRAVTAGVLGVAALLGVLPLGRLAAHRVVAAPALAGAAAYVVAADPAPERLPTVLGVSALVAAVVAATGRALTRGADEALRVWVVAGVAGFVVSTAVALAGLAAPVVWSVLLVGAVLATRFVPSLAVDVPDHYLLDLERLAVTAWSARERPRGRRGRIVVPHQAVATVAERGSRTVVAASAAVLVISTLAAPLLLASTDLPLDRTGARVLVGAAGAALLLAARSYRHATARTLLRLAGLVCWLALATVLLGLGGPVGLPDASGPGSGPVGSDLVAGAAIGVAALLLVVAVALGRGWRSAWWARRAEVAEGLSGAVAIASVVVAVGLFRRLWELTGQGLGQ